jgi:hypothetical protein
MPSPLDTSQFTTAQAAEAAGVSVYALQMQLKQGSIALGLGESAAMRSPGTGRSRVFSGRRVRHIALTEELARVGLPVKTASMLALAFTDHTMADSWPAAHQLGDRPEQSRQPGELYADDVTVFRVLFPLHGEPVASVDRAADVESSPFMLGNVRHRAVVLIDMDDLMARTDRALGAAR